MTEREARIVEIATRLMTTRLDDPTWTLDRQAFNEATVDAIDMESLNVPDRVLDLIAPRPGAG